MTSMPGSEKPMGTLAHLALTRSMRFSSRVALAAVAAAFTGGCAYRPLVTETAPGPDAGAACGSVVQLVQPVPPDILLVLDKSGSMANRPDNSMCAGGCGASSKWAQLTAAIDHVVGAATSVNWGLKLFATSNRGCGVDPGVEVPVGPSNAAVIMSAIGGAEPGSRTPTRLAENAGAAYLATLSDQRPKYLLLATDGLPNCDPANASTTADDSPGAEQAVADAFAAGFPTFVIGIGDTMAEATLNQFAIKGGVPQTGAATSYYQVGDTAGLVAAFGRILGSVSCVFDLPVPTGNGASTQNIVVRANGAELPLDTSHVNGWDYATGMTQIQIFGPTCDGLMAAKVGDVSVQFVCAN